MKKLIFILFVLISFSGFSQSYTPINGYYRFTGRLGVPLKDTFLMSSADSGMVVIRPADSSLYYSYNGKLNKTYWKKVGGNDKAYYTIQQSSDSTYVTIKSIDGLQVDTIHFQGGSGIISNNSFPRTVAKYYDTTTITGIGSDTTTAINYTVPNDGLVHIYNIKYWTNVGDVYNVYWTDLNGFQSFVFNNSSFNLNNFSVVPIYGTPNTQIIISNTNAGAKKNYIWLEESQRF